MTSRTLLAMPAPNPRAVEDARAFMQRVTAIDIERCPNCRAGRWRCVQSLPADRAALAATQPAAEGRRERGAGRHIDRHDAARDAAWRGTRHGRKALARGQR